MKLFTPKSAKHDFTRAQLPHNRREVFWDVLRLHWKDLLLMGLLTLLAALPLHCVGVFQQLQQAQLTQELADAGEELTARLLFLRNTCALWELPCDLLLAVCLSGLLRVIRQYAWLENVYFPHDFPMGIRQNLGQSLLLALLVGIVRFAVQWCAGLAVYQENALLSLALSAPLLLAALLGIPTAAYAAAVLPVYDGGLLKKLRVGMYVFAKQPLKTLAALALCLLPLGLYLLPNVLLCLAARALCSILAPFVMLGWFLFASNRLDAHVYPHSAPELVGRGITE